MTRDTGTGPARARDDASAAMRARDDAGASRGRHRARAWTIASALVIAIATFGTRGGGGRARGGRVPRCARIDWRWTVTVPVPVPVTVTVTRAR